MTYQQLYLAARSALRPTEGERAAVLARELVAFAAGKTVTTLVRDFPDYASDDVVARANSLVERACSGEPLAYILGQWEFHGMTLKVTPDVLIPRDDTEAVTQLAIARTRTLDPNPRILDLCTGSGCIGLAIAKKAKDARVTLGDISPGAIRVAKENVKTQGLNGRVNCLKINALEPASAFLGQFDMIVSNPPYVTRAEMDLLDPSVREFEPHLALDGGEDGLDFYRAIVRNFGPAVKPGGYLLFEFGMDQHAAVGGILEQAGFEDLLFQRDTGGIIRAVMARKPGPDPEEEARHCYGNEDA
jgi:release factor glutamine methyltransferase